MIQRIQSVFLLLAAGFLGAEFFTSFASTDKAVSGIFSDQVYNLYDNPALMGIAGIGAILALSAIFIFKNRSLQLKLSYASITAAIILPIIAVLIYTNQSQGLDQVEVSDTLGLYLPIGSIISTALAIRFINKDNKLVKSMDRLR